MVGQSCEVVMKINSKKGLRRIVVAFISFCVVCALGFYFINGCTFDTDYIGKVKVFNSEYNINQNLQEFANEFLRQDNDVHFWSADFKCYPYKQYCSFNNYKFVARKIVEINVINFKHYSDESLLKYAKTGMQPKLKILVTMPSPFQYLLWQLWEFIKILLIAGLLYGIYLIFEFTVSWIIKGFKN